MQQQNSCSVGARQMSSAPGMWAAQVDITGRAGLQGVAIVTVARSDFAHQRRVYVCTDGLNGRLRIVCRQFAMPVPITARSQYSEFIVTSFTRRK